MNNWFVGSRSGKGHCSSFARNPMALVAEGSTFPFGDTEETNGFVKINLKIASMFTVMGSIFFFFFLIYLFFVC